MRRFCVFTPDWSKENAAIWEDAGFLVIDDLAKSGDQPPDILAVMCAPADPDDFWQLAKNLRVKTAVLADTAVHALPEGVKNVFAEQFFKGDTLCFTVATRLEEQVPLPQWDMFRLSSHLNADEECKIIADLLYRYLLKDVMQETFEWCGHTFSVLGPG